MMGRSIIRCYHHIVLHFIFTMTTLQSIIHCLSPDGASLLSIKASIVDPHGRLDNWRQSDSSSCFWTGIACDQSNNVLALDLSNLELCGSLSAGIGGLRSLRMNEMRST
ncbi:hypothetical protein O6H91_01G073700 [Diphasiastrum complanatum]|uniref:Uncharacterized protein n=1 Tax=Diphasiastrum complanatum TaxID=34168 RepID=A0ACC2ERZ2_DIPCM|nr:hypothetical protein O6H91_01G073700 [Diphasiastrum complanatum]